MIKDESKLKLLGNLAPIESYSGKKFYFGSKARVYESPGGNLYLYVYNTPVLKLTTTGRVETTKRVKHTPPITIKAVNHFLKLHPNNLMDQVNKKDLSEKDILNLKKQPKKKKEKSVIELIQANDLEALPF